MALRRSGGGIWLPIYEFDDHKYTDTGYFLSIDYDYYNNLGVDFNNVMGAFLYKGKYQLLDFESCTNVVFLKVALFASTQNSC